MPTVSSTFVNRSSVTEGGMLTATFTTDTVVPEGHWLGVMYTTRDGTATAGVDYTPRDSGADIYGRPLYRTIFGGTTGGGDIDIWTTMDSMVEDDETFFVDVTSVQAYKYEDDGEGNFREVLVPGWSVGQSAQAIIRNYVPWTAPLYDGAFSVSDASASEGDTLTFTVRLDKVAPEGGVTVNYATSNGDAAAGTDYTAASGTLTFSAGSTTRTFTVASIEDTAVEPNETFTVTLSNASNGSILDATGTGTITNDDVAPAPPTSGKGGKGNTPPTTDPNAGSQTFKLGAGNERITTGGGNDIVVYSEGGGKDIITDFQRGSDVIHLNVSVGSNHIDNYEELLALSTRTAKKNEITFSFDNGDALTLQGVNTPSAQDWVFV